MMEDQFGRKFLRGDEGCPNDVLCFRCEKVAYKQGNPYGVIILDFVRADHPLRRSGFALCEPCSIAMWEWFHPKLASDPGYIAKKDQSIAGLRECIDHWNAEAPEGHRTDD